MYIIYAQTSIHCKLWKTRLIGASLFYGFIVFSPAEGGGKTFDRCFPIFKISYISEIFIVRTRE